MIPQQAKQTNKKILVVDDDDAIRNMVERVLRREHFEVECARDGFEAIEKLSRNDYATVLLDLMMPRVDGIGVLRFLETELQQTAPRVIVMTANLQSADETREAKPVFRILPKPFDIHQLVSHVRQCHAIEQAFAAQARDQQQERQEQQQQHPAPLPMQQPSASGSPE